MLLGRPLRMPRVSVVLFADAALLVAVAAAGVCAVDFIFGVVLAALLPLLL